MFFLTGRMNFLQLCRKNFSESPKLLFKIPKGWEILDFLKNIYFLKMMLRTRRVQFWQPSPNFLAKSQIFLLIVRNDKQFIEKLSKKPSKSFFDTQNAVLTPMLETFCQNSQDFALSSKNWANCLSMMFSSNVSFWKVNCRFEISPQNLRQI